jgi:hypothetical protein
VLEAVELDDCVITRKPPSQGSLKGLPSGLWDVEQQVQVLSAIPHVVLTNPKAVVTEIPPPTPNSDIV